MSGIPIHTQSPISPAQDDSHSTTSEGDTSPNTSSYPSARPGAAPTPTRTQAVGPRYDPPSPQPGATPIPSHPTVTAKAHLPPPPKAGEVPKNPEYYTPAHATPTRSIPPQPYPQQMTLPSPSASHGQPPASTTSTAFTPSFASTTSSPQHSRPTPTGSFPSSGGGRDEASLEHPPGYVQNPYASDMTPSQRFATEQASQSGGSEALGYNEKRRTSNAGFEHDEGLWGMAKKWAKEASDSVGSYVNDVNEKASRNFDNPK